MSEPKYSAYATAKLILEVDVSSSWGEKCDLKQVYDHSRMSPRTFGAAASRLKAIMPVDIVAGQTGGVNAT